MGMRRALVALFAGLLLGAGSKRPIQKIDRMWLVGHPALDLESPEGIYAYVYDGKIAFDIVPKGDGRVRIYQWTLRADAPLDLAEGGDCKLAVKKRTALVLVARPVEAIARCAVLTEGELTVEKAKVGRRRAAVYLGPLARRAAARVRIGRY